MKQILIAVMVVVCAGCGAEHCDGVLEACWQFQDGREVIFRRLDSLHRDTLARSLPKEDVVELAKCYDSLLALTRKERGRNYTEREAYMMYRLEDNISYKLKRLKLWNR